ncbi:hypothetical protein PIB30_021404 [Stylosanthes scabra]|uniref:DUF223 domain-containing protein n=1 Tax=Stylosanthes scabra TaxID=79078 RepID=A0ABU6T8K8_9FABA|nr:hypothetical protein [Stylosanthes scabra]
MTIRYDIINNVKAISGHKDWKLKVGILRLWSVKQFETKTQRAPINMILLDEKGLNEDIFPEEIYAFKEQIMPFKSLESTYEIIFPIKMTGTDVELSTDDDLERFVTSNVKSRRLVDEEGEKGGISTKMPQLDDSVRDD